MLECCNLQGSCRLVVLVCQYDASIWQSSFQDHPTFQCWWRSSAYLASKYGKISGKKLAIVNLDGKYVRTAICLVILISLQSFDHNHSIPSLSESPKPSCMWGLYIVFESPVQSGLLVPSTLDRNHNQSFQIEKPQRTGPNCERPVFCSLLRLQDRFWPVLVLTSLRPV